MQWKYLMARIQMARGHDDLERWAQFLDDRGREGWELVSATPDNYRLGPEFTDKEAVTEFTLFFKRPLG